MDNLFNELKRRNVFKVATAYLVVGWLVLQVFGSVAEPLGFPEWVHSFIIVLIGVGFPIALIFAWAFELTPDGVKKTEDVDVKQSITKDTSRKLDFIIIGALVLIIGGLVYTGEFVVPGNDPASDLAIEKESLPPSIAVLAFEDFSPNKDQEYFADGISDEILNLLAKTNAMQVSGRTSSFSFKGKGEDIPTIASKLKVDHILEGSISKSGNKLKITAQLINADGNHVWSETYKRDLTDIFEIQEEIAAAILLELKAKLLGEVQTVQANSTTSMEAFDHYLKSIQYERSTAFESLAKAREHAELAVALDPNFTMAQLQLINIITIQVNTGAINPEPALGDAKLKAEALLESHPDMTEVSSVLAWIYATLGDTEKYLFYMEKAKSLGANSADFYHLYGSALLSNNQRDEAEMNIRQALVLDPLFGFNYIRLSTIYQSKGEADKAIEILEEGTLAAPTVPETWSSLAGVYGFGKGDLLSAIKNQKTALKVSPQDPEQMDSLAGYYASLRDYKKANAWIKQALNLNPKTGQSNYIKAYLLHIEGHEDAALEHALETFNDQTMVHRHGSYYILIDQITTFYALKGDYAKAEAFLLKNMPALTAMAQAATATSNEAFDKLIIHHSFALQLAALYSLTDQTLEVEKILRHFKYYTPAYLLANERTSLTGEDYAILGQIAALRGNKALALEMLTKSIDHGQRGYWQDLYQYNSTLFSLHDDPRYKALVTRIETEISRQRAIQSEVDANEEAS